MGREGAHLLDLDAELAELIGGGVDGGGDLWWRRRHAHTRVQDRFFCLFFVAVAKKATATERLLVAVWQFCC